MLCVGVVRCLWRVVFLVVLFVWVACGCLSFVVFSLHDIRCVAVVACCVVFVVCVSLLLYIV